MKKDGSFRHFLILFSIVVFLAIPLSPLNGENIVSEQELLAEKNRLQIDAPESEEMFSVLLNLAYLYRQKEDLINSKKYFEEANKIVEKKYGKESKFSTIILLALGNINAEQGQYSEAEKYYCDGAERAHLCKDDKIEDTCLKKLFMLMYETGRKTDAIKYGKLYHAFLKKQRRSCAWFDNMHAKILLDLNKSSEAKLILEKLLFEDEIINSSEALLSVIYNLFVCYHQLGDPENWLNKGELCISLMKKNWSETKNYALIFADFCNAYGVCCWGYGYYKQSQMAYQAALEQYKKHLPQNDDRLNIIYQNLGELYRNLNELQKAEDNLLMALNLVKQHSPDSTGRLVEIYCCLGNVYIGMNRYSDASKYLREALSIAEKNKELYADALSILYSSYAAIELCVNRDTDKAISNELSAIAICKQTQNKNNPTSLGIFFSNLGVYYILKNDSYEAEKCFLQAIENLRKVNESHLSVGITEELLAKVYLDRKEYSQARIHLQKALKIYETNYGNYTGMIFNAKRSLYQLAIVDGEEDEKKKLECELNQLRAQTIKREGNEFYNLYDKIGALTLSSEQLTEALSQSEKLIWQCYNSNSLENLLLTFNNLSKIAKGSANANNQVFEMLGKILSNIYLSQKIYSTFDFYITLVESDLFLKHEHRQRAIISQIERLQSRNPNSFDILCAEAEFSAQNDADAIAIFEKIISANKNDNTTTKAMRQCFCKMLCKYGNQRFIPEFDAYLKDYPPPNDEMDMFFVEQMLVRRKIFSILFDGKSFDAKLTEEKNNAEIFSHEASDFLKRKEPWKFSVSSPYLKLSPLIIDSDIKKFSPSFCQAYSFILHMSGNETESKRWQCRKHDPIELLFNAISVTDNISCDDKLLDSLLAEIELVKPEPFCIDGKKYSEKDLRFIIKIASAMIYLRQQNYSKLDSSICEAMQMQELISADIKEFVEPQYNFLQAENNFAQRQYQNAIENWNALSEYLLLRGGASSVLEKRLGDTYVATQNFQTALTHYKLAKKNLINRNATREIKIIDFRIASVLYRLGKYADAQKVLNFTSTEKNGVGLKLINLTPEEEFNSLLDFCIMAKSKEITKSRKVQYFNTWSNEISKFRSPIAAECFFQSFLFRNKYLSIDKNALADFEKYYDISFSTNMNGDDFQYIAFDRSNDMTQKDLFFSVLSVCKDPIKTDYWNKIFSIQNVRQASFIKSPQATEAVAQNLPLQEIVHRYQMAKQILTREEHKDISLRDDRLILLATDECKRLLRLFEQNKKVLSTSQQDNLVSAIQSDNLFISPDTLTQLGLVLPSKTICVQFILSEDKIVVYMVGNAMPPILRTIDLSEFNMNKKKFLVLVRKIRNSLQQPQSQCDALQRDLQKMYSILFKEIDTVLRQNGIQCVLINGSGELRYLPFATLFDGSQYLVEKYQISCVTGVDLIRLAKKTNKTDLSDFKMVVFANPAFNTSFNSLPHTEIEARVIAANFPRTEMFLRKDAQLSKFEALLGKVNVLHLATHAVLDPNQPEMSYILFADNQRWYYCNMLGMNVKNLDLITLSACATALKEGAQGNEIEGLAYQLLRTSPSGSILASYWNVDDVATAKLMEIFYKELKKSLENNKCLGKSKALQKAQLALLKEHKTSHPYYWAAFTLFGDFR